MRFHLRYLLGTLLALLWCVNASAAVVVTVTAPPPKEVIIIPRGHTHCVTIPAGVHDGVFISAHQVCRYPAGKKPIWVSGHWQCSNYRPLRNVCLSWVWIPSHWTSSAAIP